MIFIAGYTPDLIHRLLESAGYQGLAKDVCVLLNVGREDLKNHANQYGFTVEALTHYSLDETHAFLIGVTKPETKQIVLRDFLQAGIHESQFANAIHFNAQISPLAKIGHGIIIETGTVIAPFASIDPFVSINRNVSIGHHTHIGKYSMINPGVNIGGRTNIGKGVFIGMGTQIVDGVSIGDNSVIGAGSVVLQDIPAGVMAYGYPCKVIKNI